LSDLLSANYDISSTQDLIDESIKRGSSEALVEWDLIPDEDGSYSKYSVKSELYPS
jgi:hypothetical protein